MIKSHMVRWSKEFVAGYLKGVWYDSELSFANLDDATRYVAWCHEHKAKPVDTKGGSNYLCHNARVSFE